MEHEFVLIVEPNLTGHRWRYAEWTMQACAEAGYPCMLVTESANRDNRLARRISAANRADQQIAFVDPKEWPLSRLNELDEYWRFHRYFRRVHTIIGRARSIRLVVVPYVDYFLYSLPFLGSPFGKTPWIGITMRAMFHHHKVGIKAPDRPVVNAIEAQLFKSAMRTTGLRTLLTIDPTLPEWSARSASRHGAAIEYVADPFPDEHAENPVLARERLGLDPEQRYLLVYGSITERKGIYELVHALTRLDHAPTLIVAGEQDEDTRDFMRDYVPDLSPAPLVLDAFISNEMERDLFSACDAVWLGYKGHYGMSGVLVQAYRFGKPVIATEDGLIGWFSRRCELGPILSDLSTASIGRAIAEAMTAWPHASQAAPSARDDLLSRHTLGHFKETLLQQMA